MSYRKLLTASALAGVGFGILEVAGVVVGAISNPVPYDTFPSAEQAARAAATPMPAGVWIGLGLEVLATLLLVAFMVRAVDAVRGNGQTLLPSVAIFAGIVNVAIIFISFGTFAARDMGSGNGLDGQSIVLLAQLTWGTYFLSWPTAAIFIGSLSAAALAARAFPGWVAWAGVVVALIGIAGCLDPTNLGQLAQVPQLLWIPAAGIALAVKRRSAVQTSAVMMPA